MKILSHIFFVLMIFGANLIFAQPNYIRYSNYINKAELCISNKEFSKALIYYDSTLLVKSTPFCRDAYNAAICAAIIKNNNKCAFYLKTLVNKGGSLNSIRSINVLNDFLKTKQGEKLLEYAKCPVVYYNKKLRHFIDSLEYADSSFWSKAHDLYADTIKKINTSNVYAFLGFIKEYGFPTEDLIGIDSDVTSHQFPYYRLIEHQKLGSPISTINFLAVLKSALEKGEIEPHQATELMDISDGTNKYGTEAYGLMKLLPDTTTVTKEDSILIQIYKIGNWGYLNLNEEYESKLNENRTFIGLGTIQEGRKKATYQLLIDKRFHLATYSIGSISTDQLEELAKRFVFVESN
ncbi:MAG TPA: hypothetical protein VFF27_11415 [Bacteroidia bacterium]|nr:hypothetical protein [Bacteroidia bacterium]